MQVMKERDDSKPIKGIIQLDDAYIGGQHRGGKLGRARKTKHRLLPRLLLMRMAIRLA